MPRRKKEDIDRETLFLSYHFQLKSALNALAMHPAYNRLADDIRNLMKLGTPEVEKILEKRNVVDGGTEKH